MARIFIDGFELGTASKQLYSAFTGTYVSSATAISGDYSIRMNDNQYFIRELPTTYQSLYISLTDRFTNSSSMLFTVRNGTTNQAGVGIRGGVIKAFRGTATISAATAGGVLSTGVVYRIESYVSIHDTTGQIVVKVNNSTVLDFTGDTKYSAASSDMSNIRFSANGIYGYNTIDDIVIDTTTWPGNTKIVGFQPASSGANTAWTPTTTENYNCVNSIPPTTVNYVHTNTTGAIDSYKWTTWATGVDATSIKCIQLTAFAEKEGTVASDKIHIAAVTSGGTTWGSTLNPGEGSPLYLTQIFEDNPITTAAWTVAEMSCCEFGVRMSTV